MPKLKKGNVRILKISKEAVFEYIYENILDNLKDYFDISKPEKTAQTYCMDYETSDFIMIATRDKDFDKGLDVDAKKLIKKIDITTKSMYSPDKKYIEIPLDELLKLQES